MDLYVYICVYLFIFSYFKMCFSYSGKEAVGSLFVFFFPPDFRGVKMEQEKHVCHFGITTYM